MCTRWSKNTGQFIFDNNHNINLNQFNQASNESREECCQGTVTVTWRLDKTTLYNYQLRTLQTWRHHSVLVNLHWLPVYKTVIFKTVALMWKCLHGEAPTTWWTSAFRWLWQKVVNSSALLHPAIDLMVPRTQWTFTVFTWNTLPAPLWSDDYKRFSTNWSHTVSISNCSRTLATLTGTAVAVTKSAVPNTKLCPTYLSQLQMLTLMGKSQV